mgnify:CR=1 FL=1
MNLTDAEVMTIFQALAIEARRMTTLVPRWAATDDVKAVEALRDRFARECNDRDVDGTRALLGLSPVVYS